MFVCICRSVTDKDIARAVEDGADSLRAVRETLDLGSQCGKCVVEAATIVKQTKASMKQNKASAELAYEVA